MIPSSKDVDVYASLQLPYWQYCILLRMRLNASIDAPNDEPF